MDQTPKPIRPEMTADQAKDAMRTFDLLCQQLLDPETDIDLIKGKQYKNKRAWRKLAMAFGISTEIINREFYTTANHIKVVAYKVRATAPNGRYAEAEGVVTSNERWSKNKSLSAMAGFAQTRASNRSIALLIAPNDLPSEEMSDVQYEEQQSGGKPRMTALMRTIHSAKGLEVPQAKKEFYKIYGHELHEGSADEVEEYRQLIEAREMERVFNEGGF